MVLDREGDGGGILIGQSRGTAYADKNRPAYVNSVAAQSF
jgi:hypothetical protein